MRKKKIKQMNNQKHKNNQKQKNNEKFIIHFIIINIINYFNNDRHTITCVLIMNSLYKNLTSFNKNKKYFFHFKQKNSY